MDIFVLLLLSGVVLLFPKNEKDYLDIKSTQGLKGILALGIIFHHLSQWVTTGSEFSNFSYMGTYIVSIFFFLSGYGLYIQNENKEKYLDGFLVKRLSKILGPFFTICFIYLIYRVVINKETIDINYFTKLFTAGTTVIYNGWFIDVIIMLYLLFYLSFRIAKNQMIAIVINFTLAIIYILLAIKLEYGFWWYNSIMPFILGLVWARYKEKIDRLITNNYLLMLVVFTVLIFISHKYDIVLGKLNFTSNYSYTIAANIDNLIFTIYFILLIKNINFNNKYLNELGRISFELYMIHGLVMSYLGKSFVSSRLNDVIFVVSVLGISILLAKIINYTVANFYKKMAK